MPPPKLIAVVAGEGAMPQRVVDGIHAEGGGVFLVAVEGLTPPELAGEVDEVVWMRHPKLGQIRRMCAKRGVEELTMVGRVPHNRAFTIGPRNMDLTAIRLWFQLEDLRADTVLKGIANELSRWGITLMSSVRYLGRYLAKKGVLTEKGPPTSALRDIDFGVKMARGLGALDIGQTVVVKNRSIVAVEAMEGTDHCLERAGEIAGAGCVVVKLPKPGQDMRFDVPVIGINTIEKLAKIQAAALAIEEGRTILIDEETVATANRLGIPIIALPKND